MMNELQKFYNWINCEGGGFVLKAVILYIMIGAAIGGILVAASEAEEDKLFIEVLATAIWPVYVAFLRYTQLLFLRVLSMTHPLKNRMPMERTSHR